MSVEKRWSERDYPHQVITDKIIRDFYNVYNTLGYGFLEKVYENALSHELRKTGFKVEQQKPIKVIYDQIRVGDYFADIVVDGIVILEIKAIEVLNTAHGQQLVNYLKATEIEVGLLLNFGKKPERIRKVFSNK